MTNIQTQQAYASFRKVSEANTVSNFAPKASPTLDKIILESKEINTLKAKKNVFLVKINYNPFFFPNSNNTVLC